MESKKFELTFLPSQMLTEWAIALFIPNFATIYLAIVLPICIFWYLLLSWSWRYSQKNTVLTGPIA
jgi:hypothetical protein